MNRKLMTLLVSGMLVAGSATVAGAHHSSDHTQNHFGLCTAYSHNGGSGGNGQGGQNGEAFRVFEETVTENDDWDSLAEYCEDYLMNNHPSDNGGGNGNGRNG